MEPIKNILTNESGVRLLGETLSEDGTFSRKAQYLINILTENLISYENAKIYRRLPEESLLGLKSGGREAVATALLLRGNARASGQDPQDVVPERDPRFGAQVIRAWAEYNGIWFADADEAVAKECPFLDEGGEARVYRADGENVIKVINAPGDGGITQLIDRIALHNFLFPETNMDVIGFGKSHTGEFCVIVNQPYVHGLCSNLADTARMVTDAGFHVIDGVRVPYTFFTENYCLGDLHERNVLVNQEGERIVIDCDARLNTPELGYGGQWVIPDVHFSAKELEIINDTLEFLLPRVVKRKWIEDNFSNEKNRLREQLELTGRYDGFLTIRIKNGEEMNISVQIDPSNPSNVLWARCEAIAMMVDQMGEFSNEEKRSLKLGYGVMKNGRFVAFDLDKGIVCESNDFSIARRKYLREKHELQNKESRKPEFRTITKKTGGPKR